MRDDLRAPALAALDALELEEAKLLAWGLVDGAFRPDEVVAVAEATLMAFGSNEDPDDLVDAMVDARLIFQLAVHGERRYRTRMAEGVRLFARLRQIFPNGSWITAPTLVADFRFATRRRVYPRRALAPADVLAALDSERQVTGVRRQALEAMLNDPRRPLQLAGFQLRATASMWRGLDASASQGMIVSSGTGTGKTLAFYLPALAHLAELVDGTRWTKGLAIYPRNELLKDQFSETYAEARRLDATLAAAGRRKLVVGAFFGPTPARATKEAVADKWERAGGAYLCPYLRCPRCEGALVWREADLTAAREQLQCATAECGVAIGEDEIVLTRQRMADAPPDLLFTTTEMLNRCLADTRFGHVFGVGAARPPRLLLLDEVHTYGGVSGAQVALLLRRWQHAIGRQIHLTGLSATLRGAGEFFATLVGLPPGAVEAIDPGDDMVAEGMAYQLALRGDPGSGASLLSTSLQAAMLMGRILEPAQGALSDGAYGRKLFAFTDDLDVTNRFFHDLLDAEGLDYKGRPIAGRAPLAALRASTEPAPADRLREGQNWLLCEQIGHPPGRAARVGRTSSQDAGVDRDSDVVIATASLEVGYNDPAVGAVMQHKAPRDVASFLQRQGRAGRRRGMRPWTLVVLSDYGRDRLAYQGYDALFDPVLPERAIPVANRYVLRMQASFATLDWLAATLTGRGAPRGPLWEDLAGPVPDGDMAWASNARQRQAMAADLVAEVLDTAQGQAALEAHLEAALQIGADEVQAILWEAPRALMTVVLPTLLRRLRTGWTRLPDQPGPPEADHWVAHHPLPDFVPANLFSDLLLPEVAVTVPPAWRDGEPKVEQMGIVQALRTFAPGRVSRRFGVEHAYASHWIAPPAIAGMDQDLAVETICQRFDEAGTWQVEGTAGVEDIRCVRPWAIATTRIPPDILETSNARLAWRTQIVPDGDGARHAPPRGTPWAAFVAGLHFHTHNQRGPIAVRRFAVGSRAGLRVREGGKTVDHDASIRFVGADGAPAALGFELAVDAVAVRFRLPQGFRIDADDPNPAKVRAFRVALFRERVLLDERLDDVANDFQRDWLQQIYLSALGRYALAAGVPLREAQATLDDLSLGREMRAVLDTIFRAPNTAAEEGDEPAARQRVHVALTAVVQSPPALAALRSAAEVLWAPPDAGWHTWAVARFKATFGAALAEAAMRLTPRSAAADLLVDLEPGPRPAGAPPQEADVEEIWLSEATVGGAGVIEELQRRYAADPSYFFRLVECALGPSDFEIVDSELTRVLTLLAEDGDLADNAAAVRAAAGHADLVAASAALRRGLQDRGVLTIHPVIAALNARVLRPGSHPGTDGLLRDLLDRWHVAEARFGVELDARIFAYIESGTADLDQALGQAGPAAGGSPAWRFQTIYGLLWPRGHAVRAHALSTYNPFAAAPPADRMVVLDALEAPGPGIPIDEPGWRASIEAAFRDGAVATLSAPATAAADLGEALRSLAAEPIDAGYLHVHPQLEGVARIGDRLEARLRIMEVAT